MRIIDDGDAGFSLSNPGQWYRTQRLGFEADYLSGMGAGVAVWSFAVNPGSYRVSITWHDPGSPYNLANSSAAPFAVMQGGSVLMSGSLNFRTRPADRTDAGVAWKDLGTFDVNSSVLEVHLSATATAFSIADAVRIERTDSTPITSPTISTTVPKNSPLKGGIAVNILGTHFVAGSQVFFGSEASRNVSFVSPTELKATSPPNAPGVVDITVITPDGLSAVFPEAFTYAVGRTLDDGEIGFTATAPLYTVNKLGFQKDYVLPGGIARDSSASWSMLVKRNPTHRVAVTWHDAGAPYNAAYADDVHFEVMDGANVLAVAVANLQEKPNDFSDFGRGWKQLGNFTFPSGQLKVVLRNKTDKVLMADAIRVEELFPDPTLTSVTPNKGPVAGGTSVVLNGSRFLRGATVRFGTELAQMVTYNKSSSLTVVTPSSQSGTVTVVVTNPDGKSTSLVDAFTFLPTVGPQTLTSGSRMTKVKLETLGFGISRIDQAIVIHWPATTNVLLQESRTLGPEANWTTLHGQPTQIGGEKRFTVNADGMANFYRLRPHD